MMDRNEPLGASIDDEPTARRDLPTRTYPIRLPVREKERIRLVPVESIASPSPSMRLPDAFGAVSSAMAFQLPTSLHIPSNPIMATLSCRSMTA